MFEIERKFLVTRDIAGILKTASAIKRMRINQMYLRDTGLWVQRVREVFHYDTGSIEYLFTMKKRVNESRSIEIEPTTSREFYESWRAVASPELSKIRHDILVDRSRWHVDLFLNPELDNLILAEIELGHEDEEFIPPVWLGREVTNDPAFRNVTMAWRTR